MNLKTVIKITLLYSACFLTGVFLLVYGRSQRFLSYHGFGIALAIWCMVGFLVFVFGVLLLSRKFAAPPRETTTVSPLDPVTRKQRMFFIKLWKLMIALSILGLVTGLSRAREMNLWVTLGSVAINLAITASLIWAVVRLQRSLK
jgi:uncharacterized membrane protein